MTKWEYCKIFEGLAIDEESKEAVVVFLGTSKEDTKSEKIDGNVNHKLAELGTAGWELVSHTMVWRVGRVRPDSSGVREFPVGETYILKREIAE